MTKKTDRPEEKPARKHDADAHRDFYFDELMTPQPDATREFFRSRLMKPPRPEKDKGKR